MIGSSSGHVTLVEFSDYQCPYCGHFFHSLDSVMAEFPGVLRVVYRHFPIVSLHPEARLAAIAAECAAVQGQFDAYHRSLFLGQSNLHLQPWVQIAQELGLDTLAFAHCITGSDVNGRLAEDSIWVTDLDLRGTPTVIIDGWVLPGTPSAELLRARIKSALRGTPRVGPSY